MSYLVQWEIDSDADDPVKAAREAFRLMQEPGTTSNFFTVLDKDTGKTVNVDLSEEGTEEEE